MPTEKSIFGRMPAMSRFVFLLLLALSPPVWAAHAYAQFGDIKYPAGFKHFEWVDPAAPKGGELRLVAPTRVTQFDKFNPFTLKGNAPPGLSELLFESLLTGTLDEPTTAYGLLADDVLVASDKLSATFHLNPAARFHNGKPVLAADVKHSFDMLTSKQAHPAYANLFADIKGLAILDERTIRFDFRRASAELPLIAGSIPVFSHEWGRGKPFDQVITEVPIASGPYRLARKDFGRDVSYLRDTTYWARDLNVRQGQFNFDRITYKIYKDTTAQTEAFKAGEFDYIQVFSAREWARTYVGKKFDTGELLRRLQPARNAGDFQAYLINTRRPYLADTRVREALALALDFEWLNRQFFYNSYTRVRGFFNASDFEAKGLPGKDELAVLEPLRSKLPAAVFEQPVPLPATTTPPGSLRNNLRRARTLLAEAGWTYRDGALRNTKGDVFRLEFLDSEGSQARIVTPYIQALAKLGIECNYRQVDFALLQKRLDVFDFDITSIRLLGSEAPGAELLDRFGSHSASTEGAGNLMGIRDPAVDALIQQALTAQTRPDLIARLRALDRVLRHGHYFVPAWYGEGFRIAWRNHAFGQALTAPQYFQPEDWVLRTWWALPGKR